MMFWSREVAAGLDLNCEAERKAFHAEHCHRAWLAHINDFTYPCDFINGS